MKFFYRSYSFVIVLPNFVINAQNSRSSCVIYVVRARSAEIFSKKYINYVNGKNSKMLVYFTTVEVCMRYIEKQFQTFGQRKGRLSTEWKKREKDEHDFTAGALYGSEWCAKNLETFQIIYCRKEYIKHRSRLSLYHISKHYTILYITSHITNYESIHIFA